ncbi:MAG TPA: hypothetical protein VFE91_04660 [Nitrososphaerales archaeon]|nr:hypothetical protein [Nitrososphaerales archaeon]
MNRFPKAATVVFVILLGLAVFFLLSSEVAKSDLVACGSTYTYGHTIMFVSTGQNTTVTTGTFNPLGTVTTTVTESATFSETPGHVATIEGSGPCTFVK